MNTVEKARVILDTIGATPEPEMFCLTKESFLNGVCMIIMMLEKEPLEFDSVKFYNKHIGNGQLSDPPDQIWAAVVINHAKVICGL